MKFGVVIFPGSNCDGDIIHVLREVYQVETIQLWHRDRDLQGVDFIMLPGGFSYGDYLRSGAVARFSPLMEEVVKFAQKGGHVMGICNGFQILCESGLLEGALVRNQNQRFICKPLSLKTCTTNSMLTQNMQKGEVIQIPVAHAEGRFHANEKTLAELNEHDQVLFRYCDENGNLTAESNPNGSVESIAGITNKTRNVFGMMPHPERAAESMIGNEDGKRIFDSILQKVLPKV